MNSNGKLAVIGDLDSALAFKAIGANVFSPKNSFEAQDTLTKLIKEEYAVVFVTENIAKEINATIIKYKTRPTAVIPIPNALGTNGFGMSGLKHDVEKAIGADVLFNK